MTLSKRDKHIIWHPFTQEKTAPEIISIKKALGAYIYDENGKAYLDLISSWWVNIHGHANEEIAQAIYNQAKTLEHVMFAGFTHEPAIILCENLQTILDHSLCKFFFSDNGSTAVEIALKMAHQYWRNLGNYEKVYFLSFEGGYHGDTFGAMSVGAKSGFHNEFENLFFTVLSIPYPDTYTHDSLLEEKEEHAISILKNYLDQYNGKISAIILEPLIQGASGMRICRPEFMNRALKLVREYGILIIFDEVMTGFCRTGTYFAYEQCDIVPDLLCISKGITGGFLPLALTITTNKIYEAFLSDDSNKSFSHGHSYTANPLACAAAITSLELLKTSKCQTAIQTLNKNHKIEMDILTQELTSIEKPRILGTIAAFDLKDTKLSAKKLKQIFLEHGLLIRPLGQTIYLLPPYCLRSDELKHAYSSIEKILLSKLQ